MKYKTQLRKNSIFWDEYCTTWGFLLLAEVKMFLEHLTNFRGSKNMENCFSQRDIHSKDDNNNVHMYGYDIFLFSKSSLYFLQYTIIINNNILLLLLVPAFRHYGNK